MYSPQHHFRKVVAVALQRLLPSLHGAKLGVAVSGGPDSVALLAALVSFAPLYELSLQVLHVNHGLRPEADVEQQLVESLCQRWHLPCHVDKVFPSPHLHGVEAWARTARYRFFLRKKEEEQLAAVALAHTRDDQAETVLFRCLRGSVRRGLAGIPPIRDGWIVRPLLNCSRYEVMQYVTAEQLPFTTDASNTDLRFSRNKIRHQLLPLLEREFSPHVRDHLVNMAEVFREEEAWLETLASTALDRVLVSSTKMSLARLQEEPEGLHTRIVRRWIESHTRGDDITFVHLTSLRDIMTRRSPATIDLPGKVSLRREGLYLLLEVKRRKKTAGEQMFSSYAYSLAFGQEIDVAQGGWRVRVSTPFAWNAPLSSARSANLWQALFDADECTHNLVVRNFLPGDRIIPLGLGKQKKVQDVFIDTKVPPMLRRTLPLIAVGELLAWVPGCVRGEVAKIRPTTRRVFRVEVIPLPEK